MCSAWLAQASRVLEGSGRRAPRQCLRGLQRIHFAHLYADVHVLSTCKLVACRWLRGARRHPHSAGRACSRRPLNAGASTSSYCIILVHCIDCCSLLHPMVGAVHRFALAIPVRWLLKMCCATADAVLTPWSCWFKLLPQQQALNVPPPPQTLSSSLLSTAPPLITAAAGAAGKPSSWGPVFVLELQTRSHGCGRMARA